MHRSVVYGIAFILIASLPSPISAKILNSEYLEGVSEVSLVNGTSYELCVLPKITQLPDPPKQPSGAPPEFQNLDLPNPELASSSCPQTTTLILAQLQYRDQAGQVMENVEDHLMVINDQLYRLDSAQFDYDENNQLRAKLVKQLWLVDPAAPIGQVDGQGSLDIFYKPGATIQQPEKQPTGQVETLFLTIKGQEYGFVREIKTIENIPLIVIGNPPAPSPTPVVRTVSGRSLIDPATATHEEKFQLLLRDKCLNTETIPLDLLPFSLSNQVKQRYSLTDTVPCYFPAQVSMEEGAGEYIDGAISLTTNPQLGTPSMFIGTTLSKIWPVVGEVIIPDPEIHAPVLEIDGVKVYVTLFSPGPYPISDHFTGLNVMAYKPLKHLIVRTDFETSVYTQPEIQTLFTKYGKPYQSDYPDEPSIIIDDPAMNDEFIATYIKPYPAIPAFYKDHIDQVLSIVNGVELK